MSITGRFKINYLLFFVVLLAFIMRVLVLDKFPVGFTPDEASFAYDAYSLLKTGRDQWGEAMPLTLKSFGDYKAPLYAYITIPFINVLGLNKTAVRLPNAILGSLAVLITYLLTVKLLTFGKKTKLSLEVKSTGLVASLLLTISSWHIMLSRGAFEANLTTFLLPLGIYLFLCGLENKKYYYFSAIIFGLNLFTYHTAKYLTPVVVLLFILVFWNEVKKKTKDLKIPTLILLAFCLVSGYTFFLGGSSRVKDINILKNALSIGADRRIAAINLGMNPVIARIIHNKYAIAAGIFKDNYLSYLSPAFLFTKGPSEATYGMLPGRGVLYYFEIPLLLGLILVLVKKVHLKALIFLILWILISPLPAALATGAGYSANRVVFMLPGMQIVLALGFLAIYQTLKSNLPKIVTGILLTILGLTVIWSFTDFINDYYRKSSQISARPMLYGNLEVFDYLKVNNLLDKEIRVSRSLSEPHIYFAFVAMTNPLLYQKSALNWDYNKIGRSFVDQIPTYRLGKVTFQDIKMDDFISNAEVIIARPEEVPLGVIPSAVIYYPDGKPAAVVVTIKTGKSCY